MGVGLGGGWSLNCPEADLRTTRRGFQRNEFIAAWMRTLSVGVSIATLDHLCVEVCLAGEKHVRVPAAVAIADSPPVVDERNALPDERRQERDGIRSDVLSAEQFAADGYAVPQPD